MPKSQNPEPAPENPDVAIIVEALRDAYRAVDIAHRKSSQRRADEQYGVSLAKHAIAVALEREIPGFDRQAFVDAVGGPDFGIDQ